MGVDFSKTRLQQSLKELNLRWEKANEHWDDKVSRDFKEKVIDPLEPKVRLTMDAMEEMSAMLHKMKRDCQ